MLAMQAAGSSDSQKMKAKVFDVANAPGTKIHPGELGKALKMVMYCCYCMIAPGG